VNFHVKSDFLIDYLQLGNKNDFVMKICIWILVVLLSGCANQSDDQLFEIISKQLYTKLDEQESKVFAYIVTVEAKTRKNVKLDRPLTRREFKDFANQEYFEESNSLKLKLEDQAVQLLKQELNKKEYCENNKYEIEKVSWRDLSVRLTGRCL